LQGIQNLQGDVNILEVLVNHMLYGSIESEL